MPKQSTQQSLLIRNRHYLVHGFRDCRRNRTFVSGGHAPKDPPPWCCGVYQTTVFFSLMHQSDYVHCSLIGLSHAWWPWAEHMSFISFANSVVTHPKSLIDKSTVKAFSLSLRVSSAVWKEIIHLIASPRGRLPLLLGPLRPRRSGLNSGFNGDSNSCCQQQKCLGWGGCYWLSELH